MTLDVIMLDNVKELVRFRAKAIRRFATLDNVNKFVVNLPKDETRSVLVENDKACVIFG